MLNQKGFAHLLLLVLLVAGLAIGLYLVTQTQIFKSRAGGGDISFYGPGVRTENGNFITDQLKVGVSLRSPFSQNASPSASQVSKRAYQIIAGKDGKSLYTRDCAIDSNQSPWKLGDGFMKDAKCPWVSQKPLSLKTLNYNTASYYKGGEQHIYQLLVLEVDKTGTLSYSRDCVLPIGKTINDLGDGFASTSLCKWVSLKDKVAKTDLSTTTYVRNGETRVVQTQLPLSGEWMSTRECPLNDLKGNFVDNVSGCFWGPVAQIRNDLNLYTTSSGALQVNNVLAYKRDNKDYLYQTIVTRNGDKLYYRDCEFNPNTNAPIGVSGTGFTNSVNSNCKFLGPYLTTDSRYGGGLVENSTAIYDLVTPTPQTNNTIRAYKIAESPADLESAPEKSFPAFIGANVSLNTEYTFKDNRPGLKTIFVRFIASDGRVENRQLSIEYRPSSTSGPVVVSPTPTTWFFDNFDRANSDITLGNGWTVTRGQFGTEYGRAFISSDCPAPGYAVRETRSSGSIRVVLAVNKQDARIPFLYADDRNHLWVEVTGSGYELKKVINGVVSSLGSSSKTPRDGDLISIVFNGTSRRVFVNGESIIDINDNSVPGNKAGIGTWCDTSMRFDNFEFSPDTNR